MDYVPEEDDWAGWLGVEGADSFRAAYETCRAACKRAADAALGTQETHEDVSPRMMALMGAVALRALAGRYPDWAEALRQVYGRESGNILLPVEIDVIFGRDMEEEKP